jgi:hypothetical protein
MITLDEIVLPTDLVWVDEFNWNPIQQKITKTLTGALVVESAILQTGRLITLQGHDNSGWITRATLLLIQSKLTEINLEMTLTLNDERAFNVIFRHHETPLVAVPVFELTNPPSLHPYIITLKLMEV